MTRRECRHGFRILGSCEQQRRLCDAAAALAACCRCDSRAHVDQESYLAVYQYPQDFADWLNQTGSPKGYRGACWSPWLWWDIDRKGDLPAALEAARHLAGTILERYRLSDEDLLAFFSGSKGFHVGLTTDLWQPASSVEFNLIARQFAENLAAIAGIEIDSGIYDKVRLFRAPNSTHPATGLHKRRLSVEELFHLSVDSIVDLAKDPLPFDPPMSTGHSDAAAADWERVAGQCRQQAAAKVQRQTATNGATTLNRLTLDFIRNGAAEGDRHRLLFSAAANLAELGCPPALAHALLTEAGLDSGLPPSEVHRVLSADLKKAKSPPGGVAVPFDQAAERTPRVEMARAKG